MLNIITNARDKRLIKALILPLFITFYDIYIETVKKPVYLMSRESQQLVMTFLLNKFILFKVLVIENKAVIFPEEALNFISLLIGECVKVSCKRVMP
jgi:hypothetical protein